MLAAGESEMLDISSTGTMPLKSQSMEINEPRHLQPAHTSCHHSFVLLQFRTIQISKSKSLKSTFINIYSAFQDLSLFSNGQHQSQIFHHDT